MVSRNCASRKIVAAVIFGVFLGFWLAILFLTSLPREYWIIEPEVELGDLRCGSNLAHAVGSSLDVGIQNTSDGQHEKAHASNNITMADQLFNKVKILCWIMTSPNNHQNKARHVMKTWGTRCNKLLFMSSAEDDEINAIPLPVKEDRDNLWAKTKESFKYIYKNHLNDYDWFLKADDDTYVIVENLRSMLYSYSAEMPVYFGCRFKFELLKQGYMSGGAGYVLSREAVRRFVEKALPNTNKCDQENDGPEDVQIGRCLENVRVVAGDSRDSTGKLRFFPFAPADHLLPNLKDQKYWYWQFIYYKTDEGLAYCSENAISFHYVTPNEMYVFDYLIYHLRPFGIVQHPQELPHKLPMPKSPKKTKKPKASTKNPKI